MGLVADPVTERAEGPDDFGVSAAIMACFASFRDATAGRLSVTAGTRALGVSFHTSGASTNPDPAPGSSHGREGRGFSLPKGKDRTMTQVPPEKVVPGNSLITATPEEGRALAITLARHSIYAMQHEEEVLKSGRAQSANDPHWLIAASHVVAVEFATIAVANHYWRTD
jgi:Hexameric tyrosine-coordinated heme protein (HTHP)